MKKPLIQPIFAFAILIVLGMVFSDAGVHVVVDWLHGHYRTGNYPGILISFPAWFLAFPICVFAIWFRRVGIKLCFAVAGCSALGVMTTPCSWKQENRSGLFSTLVYSLLFAGATYWIARLERVNVRSDAQNSDSGTGL